ncbi:MAG: hypothetical protein R3C19_16380 [Planctomycetaceae bacterium]
MVQSSDTSETDGSQHERPNGRRSWFPFAVLLAVAAVIAIAVAVRSGRLHTPVAAPNPQSPTDRIRAGVSAKLPRTESPYLNTKSGVRYIGSDACRECHEQQHASFLTTQHSQSLARDEGGSASGSHREPSLSRRSYRVEYDGDTMWHRESVLKADGPGPELQAHAIAYQIGSGHVARSYLTEDDGFQWNPR